MCVNKIGILCVKKNKGNSKSHMRIIEDKYRNKIWWSVFEDFMCAIIFSNDQDFYFLLFERPKSKQKVAADEKRLKIFRFS